MQYPRQRRPAPTINNHFYERPRQEPGVNIVNQFPGKENIDRPNILREIENKIQNKEIGKLKQETKRINGKGDIKLIKRIAWKAGRID